jgi:hypothetical protein
VLQPCHPHDQKIGDASSRDFNAIIFRDPIGVGEDTHGFILVCASLIFAIFKRITTFSSFNILITSQHTPKAYKILFGPFPRPE